MMKFKSTFLSLLSLTALVTVPTACEDEEENTGAPSIELSTSKLEFDITGGTATVELTATRDWKVDVPANVDWIAVNPKKGAGSNKPATVEISVLANKVNDVIGSARNATLKFDIGFDARELVVTQEGEEVKYTPISEIRAVGVGNTIGDNAVVCGVVISNKDLNDLTSKKAVIIQDETAGVYLYLAADASFARGDKVTVDLSGAQVSEYGGLIQINGLANDKVQLVSSDNEIVAKTVSIDDFLANKYESQYVAIADVQVQDSDLSKTWVQNDNHSNINIVDKSGKKFVVRSSKYSNFKDETVPQGSGTIKGIGSYFNSTLQLVFSDADDYKGLTGARFTVGGGGEEIPGGAGEGTKSSPYNVVKVLNIINSGKQTDAEVYVKGKISSLKDNKGADGFGGEQFGNYTYQISDDGTSTNEFMIFRGYYLNGEKFTSADQLKVGDDVVVLGKLIDYNGTPEMNSGNKIISLNGKESGEGGGDNPGDVKDPITATVAEFLAAAESKEQPYKLTGVIGGSINTTFGNFDLTDETGTVYVYGLTKTNLGYGAKNDQSYASLGLKAGDTVTLIGFRGSYSDKIEVMYSYYVSHTPGEGGGDEPVNPGTGEFDSNVTWTLVTNAYDKTSNPAQAAKVNGVDVSNVLKLGKSNVGGSATLHLKAGATKVTYYGVAWKGKTSVKLVATVGGKSYEQPLAPNNGATGNPQPAYTITVTDSDKYTITFDSALASDIDVTISTEASKERAILFGIKAE